MGGGRFQDGFLGGFAGSLLEPIASHLAEGSGSEWLGTATAAIVGGTVSIIAGGKFANGAVSAAFVDMFNNRLHKSRKGETEVFIGYKKIRGENHHTYVKVVGPDGQVYVVRAGPASQRKALEAVISEAAGLESSSGKMGRLVAVGGGRAHIIETTSPDAAIQKVHTTTDSFESVSKTLQNFVDAVNSARIEYLPLSRNSNSFAFQAVTTLGISRPKPILPAPGHDTVLSIGE